MQAWGIMGWLCIFIWHLNRWGHFLYICHCSPQGSWIGCSGDISHVGFPDVRAVRTLQWDYRRHAVWHAAGNGGCQWAHHLQALPGRVLILLLFEIHRYPVIFKLFQVGPRCCCCLRVIDTQQPRVSVLATGDSDSKEGFWQSAWPVVLFSPHAENRNFLLGGWQREDSQAGALLLTGKWCSWSSCLDSVCQTEELCGQ